MTVPVGHAVDATERFDDISPGSHHEVVRVGQDDLGAECFDVARIEMHDRPASANRHETRVVNSPRAVVTTPQRACPSRAVSTKLARIDPMLRTPTRLSAPAAWRRRN